MRDVLAPDARNLGALFGASALLAVAYVLVPSPVVQYGAWLLVFSIWMAWFVASGVRWLSTRE